MFVPVLLTVFLVSSGYGTGDFIVFHHPSSLVFKGNDPIKESILQEVYSAALGFTTGKYSNFNGMFIEDPFNLANAIITVAVDGVSDIYNGKGHVFPLKTDEDEGEIFEELSRRVEERYPEGGNDLIRVDLGNGLEEVHKYDVFSKIKLEKVKKTVQNQLKLNVDEDRDFLTEISLLNNVIDSLEASTASSTTPAVFWFKISTLHPLSDLWGENSTQVKEAKQLLNQAISRLNSISNKIYDGRVLFSVITSDASHTRRGRSILETKADEEKVDLNLAKDYNKDYPVIFNIILWFGVVMAFSLLAICIAIAEMDPGRDSIIYRMTSTRLKKDN